jgi:hypothetical protein
VGDGRLLITERLEPGAGQWQTSVVTRKDRTLEAILGRYSTEQEAISGHQTALSIKRAARRMARTGH